MNIELALNYGTKFLKNRLIPNSYLDTEILLAKSINKDRKYLLLNPNKNLNRIELFNFQKLIQRRSIGKPLAHLTNKKFFWNSEFYITQDTLIPRPDTELVVDCVLNLTRSKNNINILEIGIGSGCILLSILKDRKSFYGTGIDISKKCLNISKINAINLNLLSRLKLYKSSVDKFNLGKYDLIVSNPPYITSSMIKNLKDDVKLYEPNIALNGGKMGLDTIIKLIIQTRKLLKINGNLLLEINPIHINKVMEFLKKKFFIKIKQYKDYSSKYRFVSAVKGI